MKKLRNITIITGSLITVGFVLYGANGRFGNPISKRIAEKTAKEYIKEQYSDQNLHIEEAVYDFKLGRYTVYVESDTSVDTHFSVDISMTGKVYMDTYVEVEDGTNTYRRLEETYRNMVESVFDHPEFPFESEIDFGELKLLDSSLDDHDDMEYGIEPSKLERDKQYDIKELAKSAGHIIYYAKDEEVSFEKASEILLELKKELDEAEVPFYTIDFVLEEPDASEKSSDEKSPRIAIEDFLYRDLTKEGLEERIKEANEQLATYYEQQDKLRANLG